MVNKSKMRRRAEGILRGEKRIRKERGEEEKEREREEKKR